MKQLFNNLKNHILQLPFVKYIPKWMDKFFTSIIILLLLTSISSIALMYFTVGVIELLRIIIVAERVFSLISKTLALLFVGIPLMIFDVSSSIFVLLLPIYATTTFIRFFIRRVKYEDLF